MPNQEFDIGAEVECTDGVCGRVTRIVVDPVARTVTHIVVESRSRRDTGHLVPLEHVASTGGKVRLNCTEAQFEEFEEAQETDFLRLPSGWSGYDPAVVLSWPYYGLHDTSYGGVAGSILGDMSGQATSELVEHDNVPLGEVEVRRGDHVHATDGTIGQVHGLVIEPASRHVTHFLLEEGHLWGRKTVAIPIGAVERLDDGVRLNLTRDEVRDLPPADLQHPV